MPPRGLVSRKEGRALIDRRGAGRRIHGACRTGDRRLRTSNDAVPVVYDMKSAVGPAHVLRFPVTVTDHGRRAVIAQSRPRVTAASSTRVGGMALRSKGRSSAGGHNPENS